MNSKFSFEQVKIAVLAPIILATMVVVTYPCSGAFDCLVSGSPRNIRHSHTIPRLGIGVVGGRVPDTAGKLPTGCVVSLMNREGGAGTPLLAAGLGPQIQEP